MGGVAATILPRAAVKIALDTQGIYTGATGERLEAGLGEWLDRSGYPRQVQPSGPEDLAFVGGAAPAGDVLWDLAQQAATRQAAGAYGGAAAVWPNHVPPPTAPPTRRKRTALKGLGDSLSFEQKLAIGVGVGLAAAVALGFGAGQLVKRAELAPEASAPKKTEAT